MMTESDRSIARMANMAPRNMIGAWAMKENPTVSTVCTLVMSLVRRVNTSPEESWSRLP